MARPATQAVSGVACLFAGFVLYLAAAVIGLSHYDEPARPGPWWLTSMVVLAIVLALAGIVALLLAAVGAVRRRAR